MPFILLSLVHWNKMDVNKGQKYKIKLQNGETLYCQAMASLLLIELSVVTLHQHERPKNRIGIG